MNHIGDREWSGIIYYSTSDVMGKTLCKNKTNEILTFIKGKGNLAMNGGKTVWWDRGMDRNRKLESGGGAWRSGATQKFRCDWGKPFVNRK